MRFATFRELKKGTPRIGMVDGDEIVDLAAARPELPRDTRKVSSSAFISRADG